MFACDTSLVGTVHNINKTTNEMGFLMGNEL